MRILVAYSTLEGQTELIAERLTGWLEGEGHNVDLKHVFEGGADTVKSDYSAVILAAPLHIARYPEGFCSFVRKNLDFLNMAKTAFISVSLSGSSAEKEDRDNVQETIDVFYRETGLTPKATHMAGGAIRRKRLGWLERFAIDRILSRKGVRQNPSGETEFTDWKKLRRFVNGFIG